SELSTTNDDLRRWRDQPPTDVDVPLTVISGTRSSRMERRRRPELIAAHRRRAEQARQGRHVCADRSGHLVPFSEPALVAGEIVRVVDLVADARHQGDP